MIYSCVDLTVVTLPFLNVKNGLHGESERKFSKDPGLALVGIALKKGETFSLLIKPPTLGGIGGGGGVNQSMCCERSEKVMSDSAAVRARKVNQEDIQHRFICQRVG